MVNADTLGFSDHREPEGGKERGGRTVVSVGLGGRKECSKVLGPLKHVYDLEVYEKKELGHLQN